MTSRKKRFVGERRPEMDERDFAEWRIMRIHRTDDSWVNAAASLYRRHILFKASNRAILKIAILPKTMASTDSRPRANDGEAGTR